MQRSNKIIISIMLLLRVFSIEHVYAFGLKDVYKNLHVNYTQPGSYHDSAAGYYSGGSSVIRTKNTTIQPFAMTAPSLKTGCSGIDAYFGSFSMISGQEIVGMVESFGSQVPVYAFHIGMKTYAPQIETALKDLRNLQMMLNQNGINQCKVTQSAFAAALPQNTAMYETVCGEMGAGGGLDLGGQRKRCRDYAAQKESVARAQERDPELLMDNYNIFVEAANAVGIEQDVRDQLMSLIGTIVVKEGVMIPYPSLANNPEGWNVYINGGEGAAMYRCNNRKCLGIDLLNDISISEDDSYAGKSKSRLYELKAKLMVQTEEYNANDIGFINSIGNSFPIFDHITLEAVSNASILDDSSQLIARYMLLQHLQSTIDNIKKAVIALKQKQINDKYLTEYEKSLDKLLNFAKSEWAVVLGDADRVNARAEKIEKHLIAREKS